jgi:uncharacterized membrane protein YgdD (TMEM256/DUF423 family)
MWFSKPERTMQTAAALGALAVIAGAFGGHAIDRFMPPSDVAVYQTAVKYHFWHALALLLIAIAQWRAPASIWLARSALLFTVGCVLFSGSLYILTLMNWRFLGIITPFGGLAFILAWLCLIPASKELIKHE